MKITDVTVYEVKGRGWPGYPWVIVELQTDEGITGLGECDPVLDPGVVEGLRKLKRQVIGEDPFNIEKLGGEMIHHRREPASAVSGIEIACWDIIGKTVGTPIYKLLGGRCFDKIQVYVDGFFRGSERDPDALAEKAANMIDKGFHGVKLDLPITIASAQDLGAPTRMRLDLSYINQAANIIKAVRGAIGEHHLCVDMQGRWDLASALTLAKKLDPYDLLWIEDPLHPFEASYWALAKLAAAIQTPIATGHYANRFEVKELLEQRAAHILLTDVCSVGGILETKKIAAMADTYYLAMALHGVYSPIQTAVNLHVCTALPNFLILETQWNDVPWRDKLLKEPLTIEKGYLTVPEKPGLGVDIDRKELEKHLVQPEEKA